MQVIGDSFYKDWLTVGSFWWLTFGLFVSGLPIVIAAMSLVWSVVIVTFCLITGFLIVGVFTFASVEQRFQSLKVGCYIRGAQISLGGLHDSNPSEDIVRVRVNADRLFKGLDWGRYSKDHPAHAALLEACAEVMAAIPDLPASPVIGGHGGATLLKHSLCVALMMKKLAPGWRFHGHKNKRGEIVVPLLAGHEHRFDPKDPILPLVAFAHDIGKVICYQAKRGANGEVVGVKEVKPDHDTEGARLLRRIPELWDLERSEISALMVAIGYYHKIGSMPTSDWVGDRARSLTELLYYVDVETGKWEGGERTEPVANAAPERESPSTERGATESAGGTSEAREYPAHGFENINTPPGDNPLIDGEPDPLAWFAKVLASNGRINGSNQNVRIGWLCNGLLYVTDSRLRKVLALEQDEPALEKTSGAGSAHPWTRRLLYRLDQIGALVKTSDGLEYSWKRAMFDVTIPAANKRPKIEDRYVIVVKSEFFTLPPGTAVLNVDPSIGDSSFGRHQAINKNKSQHPNPESPQDVVQPSDDDAQPHDSVADDEFECAPTDCVEPGDHDQFEQVDQSQEEVVCSDELIDNHGEDYPSELIVSDYNKSYSANENNGLRDRDAATLVAGFDLNQQLIDVARGKSPGPKFKEFSYEKALDQEPYTEYYFEVGETVNYYDLQTEMMSGLKIIEGKGTGLSYIVIRI